MCVGKSTFKTSKLLPCDPTLQHRGKENVEFIRNKTKQRNKKSEKQQTSKLLRLWKPESRRRKKKERSQLSYIHFPPSPPYVSRAPHVDSSWCKRTVSTTSLCPVHSSPPPSRLAPLYFPVSVTAGTETAVWQCVQYDTVRLSIQYSRPMRHT